MTFDVEAARRHHAEQGPWLAAACDEIERLTKIAEAHEGANADLVREYEAKLKAHVESMKASEAEIVRLREALRKVESEARNGTPAALVEVRKIARRALGEEKLDDQPPAVSGVLYHADGTPYMSVGDYFDHRGRNVRETGDPGGEHVRATDDAYRLGVLRVMVDRAKQEIEVETPDASWRFTQSGVVSTPRPHEEPR